MIPPHNHDDDGDDNVGLVFGSGFFRLSDQGFYEDTNEIMSYVIPSHGISVQAFLVDDFDETNEVGMEILPNAGGKNVSFVRVDRSMWDFVEDMAECEDEGMFYQGLILGQVLVGTAHRMIMQKTHELPSLF